MKTELEHFAGELSEKVDSLDFSQRVHTVYNPLRYAWNGHAQYLQKFGRPRKQVLFLGINPGPWGMAQTGVPFGEIRTVQDWMGIDGEIGKPEKEHPKRPIEGFSCSRSEVSGRRLWGLMAERFGSPEEFFRDHFVVNYCPLVFMEESGRNMTPDKLAAGERKALFDFCDEHLIRVIEYLRPQWLLGVGKFAEERLKSIRTQLSHELEAGVRIAAILHPSPANPAANRGWAEAAAKQLCSLSIW